MTTLEWTVPTAEGGHRTPAFDLFSAYAVAEGLAQAGEQLAHPAEVAAQLGALGRRGGIGSARGQSPEAWSTSYRILIHHRLGVPQIADDLRFLLSMTQEGVTAMDEHEAASMWSAAFAGQAMTLGFGEVPNLERAIAWAAACRAPDGGIAWGPQAAHTGDVRATAFALRWMSLIGGVDAFLDRIDQGALVRWLQGLQRDDGGFALSDRTPVSCLWAVGYSVEALGQLNTGPLDRGATKRFTLTQHMPDGGFRRGPAHPAAEVWSNYHALSLVTAGVLPVGVATDVVAHLRRCEGLDGIVGHRPLDACADAYTTAGVVLARVLDDAEPALDFLESLRLPEDRGISYMLARGGEARSTRLVTAALLSAGREVDAEETLCWIEGARNPDGAFGIYGGRSSTPSATCAVLATADELGLLDVVVVPELRAWVSERWESASNDVEDLVLRSLLARIANFAGAELDLSPLRTVLREHCAGGGWRRTAASAPDLVSTYAALLALQLLGTLGEKLAMSAEWVRTLEREDGIAFTPGARHGGGALPTALGRLIRDAARGRPFARLPDLTL